MRTAHKNSYVFTSGEEQYKQTWTFSVNGRAGSVIPDINVKYEPSQLDAPQKPETQTACVKFHKNDFVADKPAVIEAMHPGVDAAYKGYTLGVVVGADAGADAAKKGETISAENLQPDLTRRDWQRGNSYTTVNVPYQGSWEIQSMQSGLKPTCMAARIISPQGHQIMAGMKLDGQPNFYMADNPRHSLSLPQNVYHAAFGMISGQQIGLVHAMDNQQERDSKTRGVQKNSADFTARINEEREETQGRGR